MKFLTDKKQDAFMQEKGHASSRMSMQVSQNSSEYAVNDIRCDKMGFKDCGIILFKIDINKLLGKLNNLLGKSDRLKDNIGSIKSDINSFESKICCIKNDIITIKYNIKDIRSFLLIHTKYSRGLVKMCCKCCLTNFDRKTDNDE